MVMSATVAGQAETASLHLSALKVNALPMMSLPLSSLDQVTAALVQMFAVAQASPATMANAHLRLLVSQLQMVMSATVAGQAETASLRLSALKVNVLPMISLPLPSLEKGTAALVQMFAVAQA